MACLAVRCFKLSCRGKSYRSRSRRPLIEVLWLGFQETVHFTGMKFRSQGCQLRKVWCNIRGAVSRGALLIELIKWSVFDFCWCESKFSLIWTKVVSQVFDFAMLLSNELLDVLRTLRDQRANFFIVRSFCCQSSILVCDRLLAHWNALFKRVKLIILEGAFHKTGRCFLCRYFWIG